MPDLTTAEIDRAAGLLLGMAAGDALTAGLGPGAVPGEWSEATSMAVVIARAAADGVDLRSAEVQDRIVAECASAAQDSGPGAGSGSLPWIGSLVLACLDDEDALVEIALALSARGHRDPEVSEACLLWCLAIRHAVRVGELDARVGLGRLEPGRAALWGERLDEAEARPASEFTGSDSAVLVLQGAWSTITRSPVPADNPRAGTFRAQHLRLALEAVAGENGGGAVAATAGGLLGAVYGASAVPAAWRRVLHGRAGARDLVAVATAAATGAAPFDGNYSTSGDLSAVGRHPYDPEVWIGGYKALRNLPPGVDAVVSLCRVGPDDFPPGVELIEVRLIDVPDPRENPNLGFVLHDTADLLEALRREGRTVLLHSVRAKSRVPIVACVYGLRVHQIAPTVVIADVEAVLFGARMNPIFRDALEAVAPVEEPRPSGRSRYSASGRRR